MISSGTKLVLYQLYEDGYITTKSQRVWASSISFYLTVRKLEAHGLVESSMLNSREKVWKLTEKGLKAVKVLKKIDELNEELGRLIYGEAQDT